MCRDYEHISLKAFSFGALLPYLTKRRILPAPISHSYYKEHLKCYFKLLENYPPKKCQLSAYR